MKKTNLGVFIGILILLLLISGVSATVITFDDFTGTGHVWLWGYPSKSYAGLKWDPDWKYYDVKQIADGYEIYKPHSGKERIAASSIYKRGWIAFPNKVIFQGAWLSGLRQIDSNPVTTCNWQGFNEGIRIGTSSSLIVTDMPTFLPSGFSTPVDNVTLVCDNQYFVVDDVTYESGGVPLPKITKISPSSGTMFGGTSVTITGTGFTGVTKIIFNSTEATDVKVIDDETITAISPSGFNGTIDVTVTNSIGTSNIVDADKFTYTLPEKFDWRDYKGQNWMTPVRDQREWGACWVFSTIGSVEAKYNIEKGTQWNLDLSEWDLYYQLTKGENKPGLVSNAYTVIHENGIVDEYCNHFDWRLSPIYHDPLSWGRCSGYTRLIKSNNHVSIYSHDESILDADINQIKKLLMEKGPISVALKWGTKKDAAHAMVLTGWDDTDQTWIYKNSWGPGYNKENTLGGGYTKIAYKGTLRSKIWDMDWSDGIYEEAH
jgi:hypothetical protein